MKATSEQEGNVLLTRLPKVRKTQGFFDLGYNSDPHQPRQISALSRERVLSFLVLLYCCSWHLSKLYSS